MKAFRGRIFSSVLHKTKKKNLFNKFFFVTKKMFTDIKLQKLKEKKNIQLFLNAESKSKISLAHVSYCTRMEGEILYKSKR